ncbi:MAG: flagellin [Deltaproteobacteria bacterium]|jgi:flagellin
MPISIGTNTQSLNAQRALSLTQNRLSGNLEKLSTGMRINNAADDAAGLAISERFKAQIRSLGQAERNAMDGISLTQTAEGAMNEMSGVLTRMRELAVQASNGTLGTTERQYLDDERSALTNEITRIAQSTRFNGQSLLTGGDFASGVALQVGLGGSLGASGFDTVDVVIASTTAADLGVSGLDFTTQSSAQAALTDLDSAIDTLSSRRAGLGAIQNRLQVSIANLGSARENISAANSRIRDVDVASETAEMTRNNILMQAGVSILAQANQAPSVAMNLLR